VHDALADAQQALHDLTRGLDQLAWFGRWCNDRSPASSSVEPLNATLARLAARVRYGALHIDGGNAADVRVRGGEALERLLELLVVNGHQHAPRSTVRLSAREQDGQVVIDVEDDGKPVAPELSEMVFTLDGQAQVKGRSEGRYSRVLGLFSASVLAQSLSAPLSASERAGKNVFTVKLSRIV
jgi:signal transduction histidine kinase